MSAVTEQAFAITQLSSAGELTLPESYQAVLPRGVTLMVVQVGDALVITPHDKAFAEVTGRLEAALRESGSDVEDLIKAAEEARAEIVREEFGDLDEAGQ